MLECKGTREWFCPSRSGLLGRSNMQLASFVKSALFLLFFCVVCLAYQKVDDGTRMRKEAKMIAARLDGTKVDWVLCRRQRLGRITSYLYQN